MEMMQLRMDPRTSNMDWSKATASSARIAMIDLFLQVQLGV